jgi:hypothetical protein
LGAATGFEELGDGEQLTGGGDAPIEADGGEAAAAGHAVEFFAELVGDAGGFAVAGVGGDGEHEVPVGEGMEGNAAGAAGGWFRGEDTVAHAFGDESGIGLAAAEGVEGGELVLDLDFGGAGGDALAPGGGLAAAGAGEAEAGPAGGQGLGFGGDEPVGEAMVGCTEVDGGGEIRAGGEEGPEVDTRGGEGGGGAFVGGHPVELDAEVVGGLLKALGNGSDGPALGREVHGGRQGAEADAVDAGAVDGEPAFEKEVEASAEGGEEGDSGEAPHPGSARRHSTLVILAGRVAKRASLARRPFLLMRRCVAAVG